MPIISTSLPSDGTTIDAADVNTPFNDILNVVNGNIDSDNVATGGLNYENFGTITGEIPASDMQDSGNLEKFRDEANVAFVASGCVWSTLTGLNGAMTAGVVYNANGVRNAPGAVASKTFTASRDTYVDIATNGAVSYSEVVNNDPSPALTANYVRIAKVVTDGSGITTITQSGVDSLGNPIRNTALATGSNISLSNGRTAYVATTQTTTSTSYTDLATAGPAVTVTVGTSGTVLVSISSVINNNTGGFDGFMGFALSGANTMAAQDKYSIRHVVYANNYVNQFGATFLLTELTPGSTVFTSKYKTGGNTASFGERHISVIPL